jgi:DNA-directed RNA polymerase subunit alpha
VNGSCIVYGHAGRPDIDLGIAVDLDIAIIAPSPIQANGLLAWRGIVKRGDKLMEQSTREELRAVVERESWTLEDQEQLRKHLASLPNAPATLRTILTRLESATPEIKGAAALKIGIARYMLCRFEAALEALGAATDNKDRRLFQALCCKELKRYDAAAEDLRRALDRGADPARVQFELVEVEALRGNFDAAGKELAKLAKTSGESGDYYYLKGLIDELSGNAELAADSYQKACETDGGFGRAAFRLAYHCDLHGDEQRAVELYRGCLTHPPVRVGTLLNLAVLYEDAGHYAQATACLKSILATDPTHERARLFLRDVNASKTMYYDEDRARRIAKRNAVLDIPVTDFELSVRARNCLKKMNIRCLGDLVNISEPELLSYKNFGETSLKEIKEMLAAKNLRLGQALEEDSDFPSEARAQEEEEEAPGDGVRATPIDRVEFSVRSRRALESLRIKTLADLASRTEADLMGCRNFGQTSLNEVRQRLAEFGLRLREPS